MSFAPHLWDLLGTYRVEVSIKIHPRIETSELQNNSRGRKQLSQACYDAIAQGLSSEPAKSLGVLPSFPGILRRQPF
jgi:hypothetical protein